VSPQRTQRFIHRQFESNGRVTPTGRIEGEAEEGVQEFPRREQGAHATSEDQAMGHGYAHLEAGISLCCTVTPGKRAVYILI
jgi:hypothetical protein